MWRKRIPTAILFVLIALVIGGTIQYGSRGQRQAALDQELIRAIKRADDVGAERALQQGASAQAEDWSRVPPIWIRLFVGMLRGFSRGKPMSALTVVEEESGQYSAFGKTLAGSRLSRIMDLLIQHGADPNFMDTAGTSLLMDAIYLDDEVLAEHVLKVGANANFANSDGDTALMWAAGKDEVTLVNLLLSHGANPNAQNHTGQTALMWATGPINNGVRSNPPTPQAGSKGALQGHKMPLSANARVVAALLAAGANTNLRDQNGNSAPVYAVLANPWLLSTLLTHGGDVNARIATTSLGFKQRYYGGGVGWVMSYGPTNEQSLQLTLLMKSAIDRNVDSMQLLLSHHANIDAKDRNGKTALQLASDPQIQALLRRSVPTGP